MKPVLLALGMALGVFAAPASAATYSGLHGVIKEGPNVVPPNGYTADFELGDFPWTKAKPGSGIQRRRVGFRGACITSNRRRYTDTS